MGTVSDSPTLAAELSPRVHYPYYRTSSDTETAGAQGVRRSEAPRAEDRETQSITSGEGSAVEACPSCGSGPATPLLDGRALCACGRSTYEPVRVADPTGIAPDCNTVPLNAPETSPEVINVAIALACMLDPTASRATLLDGATRISEAVARLDQRCAQLDALAVSIAERAVESMAPPCAGGAGTCDASCSAECPVREEQRIEVPLSAIPCAPGCTVTGPHVACVIRRVVASEAAVPGVLDASPTPAARERFVIGHGGCGARGPSGAVCWFGVGHDCDHEGPPLIPGLTLRESAERGVVVWAREVRHA